MTDDVLAADPVASVQQVLGAIARSRAPGDRPATPQAGTPLQCAVALRRHQQVDGDAPLQDPA